MNLEVIVKKGFETFRIPCDNACVELLCAYVLELARWNSKMNLTGLKDPSSIMSELIYDAFFLESRIEKKLSVLDLGSGSGVLAVPLVIFGRKAPVYSIDKSLRKIQFQRHVKRIFHLADFVPLHGRSEEMEPLNVDRLVVKAFGSVTEILAKGGGHLKKGGQAMIVKSEREKPEYPEGFSLVDAVSYALSVAGKPYKLLIYEKVS